MASLRARARCRRRAVRSADLAVEALALASHLDEQRRRLEARAEALLERARSPQHFRSAEDVHVAERTAAKGREADAEDRSDVAVPRAPQDALVEAAQRFVHERHGAAETDLVRH